MLRDVKLKLWQSIAIALVISLALLAIAFQIFLPGQSHLLVPVAS